MTWRFPSVNDIVRRRDQNVDGPIFESPVFPPGKQFHGFSEDFPDREEGVIDPRHARPHDGHIGVADDLHLPAGDNSQPAEGVHHHRQEVFVLDDQSVGNRFPAGGEQQLQQVVVEQRPGSVHIHAQNPAARTIDAALFREIHDRENFSDAHVVVEEDRDVFAAARHKVCKLFAEHLHQVELDVRAVVRHILPLQRNHYVGEVLQPALEFGRRGRHQIDRTGQQATAGVRAEPLPFVHFRRGGRPDAVVLKREFGVLPGPSLDDLPESHDQGIGLLQNLVGLNRQQYREPAEMGRVRRDAHPLHPFRLQEVPLRQLIDALLEGADRN